MVVEANKCRQVGWQVEGRDKFAVLAPRSSREGARVCEPSPPIVRPGQNPPMPGSRRHHRAASSFSSFPILYHRRLSSSSVVSRRRGAAEWTLRHRVGLASAVIRGGFFRMLSPRAGGRCRSVHRAESVDIVWGGRSSRGMGRDDFVRGGAMEGRQVVDEVGWRRPCVT